MIPSVIPVSTYRVQFGPQFRFPDGESIVPYLDALGIGHLYASPYFRARPGSRHGYDIVDHTRLNPEIGDVRASGSRHPEGDLKRVVFSVPARAFALARDGERLLVRYATSDIQQWDFGALDKSRLAPSADD